MSQTARVCSGEAKQEEPLLKKTVEQCSKQLTHNTHANYSSCKHGKSSLQTRSLNPTQALDIFQNPHGHLKVCSESLTHAQRCSACHTGTALSA